MQQKNCQLDIKIKISRKYYSRDEATELGERPLETSDIITICFKLKNFKLK